MSGPPTVFISYSWDGEEHKLWVRELAERLVSNGVHVKLDQWDLVPGDSLTEFMEAQIQACDFVLVICTPSYAKKSTERAGGVGYEQQIISGNLAAGVERRKFIPLVRAGEMKAGPELAIPPHFLGTLAIDMRGPDSIDGHLEPLLRAIFKVPAVRVPALGAPPPFAQEAGQAGQAAKPTRSMRLPSLEFDGWELKSGVAVSELHPDTFQIPDAERRSKVVPTDLVKLMFEVVEEDGDGVEVVGERMWVRVGGAYGPYLWGVLSNDPVCGGADIDLARGSEVIFLPEHIIDIVDAETQRRDEEEFWARVQAEKISNGKS